MSEKPSKFEREARDLRREHVAASGGLELARQLKLSGEKSRDDLQERTEYHREAIRQLHMDEEDKAPHLASMAPKL